MEDEILQEFLAESWENLSKLDSEIVALEKDPSSQDLLASIFRTIHTIKGTCGFIGLVHLGAVAHSAENVLGKMRSDELEVSVPAISLVLESVDIIKKLLEVVEATGKEPGDCDNTDLIVRLEALANTGKIMAPASSGQPAEEPAAPEASIEAAAPSEAPTPPETPAQPANETPAAAAPPAPASEAPSAEAKPAPAAEAKPSAAPAAAKPAAPAAQTPAAKSPAQTPNSEGAASAAKGVADLSIRVNVNVLDSLMNLVGELVLTRNQLLQLSRGDDESKYATPITHLNRVTTDLQEGVMKTRMQPIGNAWSKLPRLVRDLSQVTEKTIELEMVGAETELDRTVLDAIKDPLTHMVRNSADHGVESVDVRRAAGKSDTGTIRLRAFHEGGHVIICIEDDGAGINADKVLNKAIANGVVSETEAAQMSENEILRLIFNAGLSTAEQISSVSGRGVGMDVVKTQIEKIGGTVDLTSVVGRGTTVRIKIPLTLAIISALVVESGGESFAIPQLGVVELVRLTSENRGRIEKIHDQEVFRLRDRLLPLIYLDKILGLGKKRDDEQDRDVNIVVVQVGEEQFGLIVDEVFDTEEIVVKPMGRLLKDIDIYQGTTILGDGRVIMILDIMGVATQFGGVSNSGKSSQMTDAETRDTDGLTSLLLFDAGDDTTMAVPLSLVARLEEFAKDKIEESGAGRVVQYRGDLLPLQPVNQFAGSAEALDPQPVIVFSEGEQSMGLMVNQIQDILNERLDIRMQSQKSGVLGTAIVNGNATDVIDTQHYIIQANPEWFTNKGHRDKKQILAVDDSLFFRQLVSTALESEGYEVVTVESAAQAIDIIDHGKRFDAIISDIEMPEMDGIEFAAWVRGRANLAEVPLIALTSLAGRFSEARIQEAGFDQYLKKFNAGQLVSAIDEILQRQTLTSGETA